VALSSSDPSSYCHSTRALIPAPTTAAATKMSGQEGRWIGLPRRRKRTQTGAVIPPPESPPKDALASRRRVDLLQESHDRMASVRMAILVYT